MSEQLLSVIIGVLLGGAVSFVSFYFKSRIEVRTRVNTAIFHLLEVWSIIGMMRTIKSKEFAEKFVQRLKVKFPRENLGPEPEREVLEGMVKVLPIIIDTKVSGEHFLRKYTDAVSELAPIFPVQAYQLNKNQLLLKYLDSIDELMSNDDVSDSDQAIVKSFKSFANQDAMNEFENDLKQLSKKTSFFGCGELNDYIDRLKNRINELPDHVFDELIEGVLSPVVQDHYDRLGIKNPNTAR